MLKPKQPELRIVVPIGKEGATDEHCGDCNLVMRLDEDADARVAICALDNDILEPDNEKFKRTEYCKFQTLNIIYDKVALQKLLDLDEATWQRYRR